MKVAFLVNDLHLSGGVATVVRHASLLRSLHDVDAQLVIVHEDAPVWDHHPLEAVPTRSLAEIATERFDVAVATWWETATKLDQVTARRRAYFVQSLEDRFYEREHLELAFAARGTLDLPVAFITEARWIRETLRQLRPEAPCFYVRNGVAKDVFVPLDSIEPRLRKPLRIAIEGRADVWFKGVPDAVRATERMREARHVTLVSPTVETAGPDRILGSLPQTELADVYERSDVLLKLSRVEGMYGPPLEAFHRGCTCVTTPVTGYEEYIVHGWNALVVDWDDVQGTARALDLLCRDRRLLHFLRMNALATARAWPTWEQSSQFMALALRAIAAGPEQRASPRGGYETRLAVTRELARESGVAQPMTTRTRILSKLWSDPRGARILRAYGRSGARRVISPIARRLLR